MNDQMVIFYQMDMNFSNKQTNLVESLGALDITLY